jgi:hypothetical protein
MNNPIPDFVTKDFAARCANPRGQMPAYARRWWTPGVAADVDSGYAASTQCAGCILPGEQVTVYDADPADSGRAVASWNRAHHRWNTLPRSPRSELGRTPDAAAIFREGFGWAL